MKKFIVFAGAFLATLALGWAAQNSAATIRQVRDPVQLKALLDSNAADAQSRIAAIEAIDGAGGALAPGYIVIGNAATVSTAVAVSGAMTIATNGETTLAGNIPVARITNAAATVGASIGGNIPVAAITNALTTGGASIGGNITVAALTNALAANLGTVDYTNVIVSADAKTNTIIVINGLVTSWVVTE